MSPRDPADLPFVKVLAESRSESVRAGEVLYPPVSVVVPVYNNAEGVPKLVERLEPVLSRWFTRFELVLVNDGSPDRSWEAIRAESLRHGWIRGIDHMRNYGQHAALLTGIRAARYPVIVTMDDDLQNPPEEIPALVDKLGEGFDVVYGKPREERHGLWRDAASRLTKVGLGASMGSEAAKHVSAFRAFRSEVRNAFAHYDGPFVAIDVMLTWGTRRFGWVAVSHDAREQGASGYTLAKLVKHAIDLITGFTTLPLRIATFVGFAFTLFGMSVIAYVLLKFLIYGAVVPGFAFLASIISIFAGAQLFALGVLGEYLARIHFRTMGVPSAVVRERTDD